MVLVGGTNLSVTDLPFGDILGYTIENNEGVLKIKLGTSAKKPNCIKVYLHEDLRGIKLASEVFDKTIYFESDDDLVDMLANGEMSEPIEDNEIVDIELQAQEQVDAFNSSNEEIEVDEPKDIEEIQVIDDVIDNLDDLTVDDAMILPDLDIDLNADNLTAKLKAKDKEIEQLQSTLEELRNDNDVIYEEVKAQIIEIESDYKQQISEANSLIKVLKDKVNAGNLSKEDSNFLKLGVYSKNPKAMQKVGFTQEEKERLNRLNTNIYVFACGHGDSITHMLHGVKSLIDNGADAVIADFTGDNLLNYSYRNAIGTSRASSLQLANKDIDVNTIAKSIVNCKFIPTELFNDIALMNIDWVTIINNLLFYAGGKPIIILLNSINYISNRYALTKLSAVGVPYLFAKCSPLSIMSLMNVLKYIPECKPRIVALNYIEEVERILITLRETGYTVATAMDVKKIVWSRIGVRV